MEYQTNTIKQSENKALYRFALVSAVKSLVDQQHPIGWALAEVSNQTFHSSDGSVPIRTLEDWWYAYKDGGFEALKSKARADGGKPRAFSEEEVSRILGAVRHQPEIAIKVHYREWKKSDPKFPSLSAVHRLLWANDLNKKQRRALIRRIVGGPTKAWESAGVNELWMVDYSPGPWIQSPHQSKAKGTHLCAIIDDFSRLVPCARYVESADTRSFHSVLKEALLRRGIPKAIYADNGGPFVNDHTRIVCAQLGVRLLHTRPYHAWSKGKIERLFFTIQEDFEASLKLPGKAPATLDELNLRLANWLQEYHSRIHSTTNQTPQLRYSSQAHQVRSLDPSFNLDRAFFHKVERLVRSDLTVRLDNDWFEVSRCLCGLKVFLHYDPWTKARIEVFHRGQSFGVARKLNRSTNGQS